MPNDCAFRLDTDEKPCYYYIYFIQGGTYEKVHKNNNEMHWGGVLAFLAFSLITTSCSNNSDSSTDSPSPTLPTSVGKNPVLEILGGNTETNEIKLGEGDGTNSSPRTYLILKADGTAELYYDGGDIFEQAYKYTWDSKKQEIYIKVEKDRLDDPSTPRTYDELLSKISTDDIDELESANLLKYWNALFKATITYKYEIKDKKMMLTEKFTGVKNLIKSQCSYSNEGEIRLVEIDCSGVTFYKTSSEKSIEGEELYGTFGKGNSIEFEEEKKTGSYTEDIAKEKVTVTFDGNDYECKFEGQNFTQVD